MVRVSLIVKWFVIIIEIHRYALKEGITESEPVESQIHGCKFQIQNSPRKFRRSFLKEKGSTYNNAPTRGALKLPIPRSPTFRIFLGINGQAAHGSKSTATIIQGMPK